MPKMVDIKATIRELKEWLVGKGEHNPDNESRRPVSLFGKDLHIHIHLSINPTFIDKDRTGG